MAKEFYDKALISNRNGSAELYAWRPYSVDKKIKQAEINGAVGCNLFEDNVVTYVYELLFVNGANKRIPYVVCDYVQ